ncbi:MAG: hypothetical protein AAGI53_09095 [Planctomycetota bacterium]
MSERDPRTSWARRLRRFAERGLERHPGASILLESSSGQRVDEASRVAFRDSFTDERGHRRAIDAWLLNRLLGIGIDAALPAATKGGALDVGICAGLVTGDRSAVDQCLSGSGSLVPFDPEIGIERWTQTELGALHALGVWASHGVGVERVRDAGRWSVSELQPDNATNHAWALHVFVELGLAGEAEAEGYAGTLLHNATVAGGGVPDVFSSVLLLDAARVLEEGGWLAS